MATNPSKDIDDGFLYDEYPFQRTTWTCDATGSISTVSSVEIESILVVQNWKNGKKTQGYISEGSCKYAFRVCFSAI